MEAKIRKKLEKEIIANPVGSPEFNAAQKAYLELLKQDEIEKDNSDKNVQREKEFILKEKELDHQASKDEANVQLEYAKLQQKKEENEQIARDRILDREETRKTRRLGFVGSIVGTLGSIISAVLVTTANNRALERRAEADRQYYADQINNVLEFEQTGSIRSTGAKTVVKDGLKGPKM